MFDPRADWDAGLPLDPADQRLADSEFAEAASDLPADQRAALGWTLLLGEREWDISSYARDVTSFQWAAVGILHPDLDADLGQFPQFGVILYADEDDQPPPYGPVGVLEFPEAQFPVVVRRGTYIPHHSSLPSAGT